MTRGQVEKAEREALNEFDKWNEITGFVHENTGYYYELQSVIKDAVHIGIHMALFDKIAKDADGNIVRNYNDK